MRSGLPLRVAFSVLRLSRRDPAEAVFLALLAREAPPVATNASPVTLADVTPIARLTGEAVAIAVPAAVPIGADGRIISSPRPDAFPAIGRQSKGLWLALTGGATLVALAWFSPIGILGIASIVIASVYLLDIRPKVAEILSGQ